MLDENIIKRMVKKKQTKLNKYIVNIIWRIIQKNIKKKHI